MATNPRLPEDRDVHPKLPPQQNKSGAPWVLAAIVVAAVILAALIIWLPRTPRKINPATAAQVPQQPTGNQLQLTNLKLSPSPAGNAVDLDGMVTNTGDTDITGIAVSASFKGINGANLETIPAKVMGVQGGNSGGDTEDLTKSPIKPGETRAVRIPFPHVPAGWNKALPEVKVTEVTAAGQPGQNIPPQPNQPQK